MTQSFLRWRPLLARWLTPLIVLLLLLLAPLVLPEFRLNLLGKFVTYANRGAGAGSDLGLQRTAQPGPGGLLRRGRLRNGDVYEAGVVWR